MALESAVQALDVDDRDRFIMIYDDVWQVLKGKTSLSVYMSLKRRVNPDRKYWYGTYNSLSEEAGVSPKTFQRCIDELEGIGLVISTRRFVPKGWDRKDNSKIAYREKPDKGYEEIGKLYQVRFHMPSGKSDQTGGGKSDQTPPGKSDQTGGGKSDQQTYIPSDIDTQDTDTRSPLPPKGADDASVAGGEQSSLIDPFDEWWKHVNKKQSKGDARKAFKTALKKADLQTLINGIQRSQAQWQREQRHRSKTPHPATWLRAEAWLDEIPDAPDSQPSAGSKAGVPDYDLDHITALMKGKNNG